MTETPLTALMRAWKTTMLATTVLIAALALSQVWDGAVFFRALEDAVALGGQDHPVSLDYPSPQSRTATDTLRATAPLGRLVKHGEARVRWGTAGSSSN
jgi:hypothetical protein